MFCRLIPEKILLKLMASRDGLLFVRRLPTFLEPVAMNTTCRFKVLSILFATLFCVEFASAERPGERPPREVIEKVQPLLGEARRALELQDSAAIRVAVAKVVAGLGPWAGNPETATRYYPPVVTTPFDSAALRRWWLSEIERGKGGLLWLKNPQWRPPNDARGPARSSICP